MNESRPCQPGAEGGFSVCAGVEKILTHLNWNLSFVEGGSLQFILYVMEFVR
jgi:hypothetical protein